MKACGLEAGSFSSGQVADPLGIDSKKNSWPNEKHEGLGEFAPMVCERDPFSEFPGNLKPAQGMAIEASAEKHSNELMVFDWKMEGS